METLDYIQNEIRNSENFERIDEINRRKFEIVNQVGIIYAIGEAILYQCNEIYIMIFRKYFPDFLKANAADSLLLCSLIVYKIFGLLFMFLLTKFIKKITIKKRSYGCKKYFANLFINNGLLIVGSFIGYIIQFSNFNKNTQKNEENTLKNESKNDSNIFFEFFVICLAGPIAEEFIFRKFLIDRLAIYSKTLAIFSSGIIFGISHKNLLQLFGAMLSGWALAYSYAETGNILIPISYHIFENSITTINKSIIPEDFNNNQIRAKIGFVIIVLRLIAFLIGIILLIIYRRKIKVTGEENKSSDKWKFFKSYGMWIFVLEGFLLFVIFYML